MIQAIALERLTATDTSLRNTESKSENWHWAFYPWTEDDDDLVPEIAAVPSSACTGCQYFSDHEYLPCAVHPVGRPEESCADFVQSQYKARSEAAVNA